MKEYTAIYSTESLKDIHYSFRSKDDESAIEFCKYKFSAKSIKLIEDTCNESGKGRLVCMIER